MFQRENVQEGVKNRMINPGMSIDIREVIQPVRLRSAVCGIISGGARLQRQFYYKPAHSWVSKPENDKVKAELGSGDGVDGST